MNIINAQKVIAAAAMANDTVIIEGVHGLGKSAIVKQYAKETNANCVELFLSHMEMGDVLGMPRTIERAGSVITTWSAPGWIQSIIDRAMPASMHVDDLVFEDADFKSNFNGTVTRDELNAAYCSHYGFINDELHIIGNQTKVTYSKAQKSILFLDELNRAPIDVRQGTMQLILEKELHEHKLPYIDGVQTQIVAAINPAGQYQVDELDDALLDRFLHIQVDPDAKSWLEWAKSANINEVVRDYLTENPKKIHFMPQDGGIGATPRSWTKLAAFIDRMKDIPSEIHYDILKGKIGSALGSEFLSYYNTYSKALKMEDIVKAIAKAQRKDPQLESVGKAVNKMIKPLEPLQKSEMASKFLDAYINKTKATDAYPLMAYLYGLDLELRIAFVKSVKESDAKHYKQLATFDGELNDKQLFKSLVQSAYKES